MVTIMFIVNIMTKFYFDHKAGKRQELE